LPQYGRFVLSCSAGAATSWSTTMALVSSLPWCAGHPVIASTAGILAGAVLNYGLCSLWVFRAPWRQQARAAAAGGRTRLPHGVADRPSAASPDGALHPRTVPVLGPLSGQ